MHAMLSISNSEVAGELLAHAARTGALRPGLILIGDKGFAGRETESDLAGRGILIRSPSQRRWLRSGTKSTTGMRTATQARQPWQCGR